MAVLLLASVGSANAFWKDYGVWWGGNDLCRGGYTEATCKPPMLSPELGQNLSCTYYHSTTGCCCQGLVWAPDRPDVTATANGNSVNLSWNEDPGANSYGLYWGDTPDFKWFDERYFKVDGNTFTHGNLNYNTDYYYVVIAYGTYGSKVSQVVKATSGADPAPNPNPDPDPAPVPDPGSPMASIDAHLSNQGSFDIQRWATRQGGFWDGQKWLSGNFNGDGVTDLANVFNDGGETSIDVHLSDGGNFDIQRWATKQGGFWDGQKWLSGDFNGDGVTDLTNVFNDGGETSIDVHLSDGGSFGIQRWATKQGGFWDSQKWSAGDFNGDGQIDTTKVFSE